MRAWALVQRTNFKAICPYCRDALNVPSEIVSCSQCRTLHHRQCWKTHQRCSVFGCRGTDSQLDGAVIAAYVRRRNRADAILFSALTAVFAAIVILETERVPSPWWETLFGVAFLAFNGAMVMWAISRASRCPACGRILEWRNADEYLSCSQCGARFAPRRDTVEFPHEPGAQSSCRTPNKETKDRN
jgi:ribosomal protein L37AE/L43A